MALWPDEMVGNPQLTVLPGGGGGGDGRGGHPSARKLENRFVESSFTEAQLGDLPESAALIGGVLDLDTLTILFGAPKSGKSFIALSWALAAITGTSWLGGADHPVSPSAVVYVAAEGHRGLRSRIGAWRAENNVTTEGALYVQRKPVRLMLPLDVDQFIEYAVPLKPSMIVFDTLARCMVGADENSARDVGQVIDHLEQIRAATGAAVIGVHHTTRSGENMRGSSAFDGAVDMGYAVTKQPDRVKLERRFAKDHPDGKVWALSLVAAGGSRVVTRYRPEPDGDLSDGAMALLGVLDEIDPNRQAVPKSEWAKARPSQVAETAFARVAGGLIRRGYVDQTKSGNSMRCRITDAGLHALAFEAGQLPVDVMIPEEPF